MSYSNNLSPLAINALGAYLDNKGLCINKDAVSYMGVSASSSSYTKGTLVSSTCLTSLVDAINGAYPLIDAVNGITSATYANLISIGSTTIPALGDSKPSTYTLTYSGASTQWGWLRVIPEQAHKEFYVNTGAYSELFQTYMTCYGYMQQNNRVINSAANSKEFLSGVYSNMNDLSSSDITGVNIATTYWGQDLINAGRSIDLSKIATFGLPSNLLFTMRKNNALTPAVSLAMLSSGFTASEVGEILGNLTTVTNSQEKQLYASFSMIVGKDLLDVCVPMNVQTKRLNSLVDLLNPQMLFPNSYISLTVPKYNVAELPTNSKTYYPIYMNGAVNSTIENYGTYLEGIVPSDIAIACGAFSMSMQQIKNIQNSTIEKFAQVVTNIETMKGLGVNGTSVPVNATLANNVINALAGGSGTNGSFLMNDFFGAATGLKYDYKTLQGLILNTQTSTLATIYNDLKTVIDAGASVTLDADVQTLIDSANAEILNIYNTSLNATQINTIYNAMGSQLTIEINSRSLALPYLSSMVSSTSDTTVFADMLKTFATETQPYQSAQVIEALSNLTDPDAEAQLGGQSTVGVMRETRNNSKLGLAGLTLESDVPPATPETPTNNLGIPKVTGATDVPGSFGGSAQTNLIPPNLDIFNITGTVLNSVVTPTEALADVITCNCDCWDNI